MSTPEVYPRISVNRGRFRSVQDRMNDLSRRDFLAISAALAALPDLGRPDQFVVHEWGVITLPYGTPYANLRTGSAVRIGAIEAPPGLPAHALTWRKVVGDAIEEWKNAPVEVFKPIVYFYPPKAMTVNVKVSVPGGRPSAWWPAADYGPKPKFPVRGGRRGLQEPEPPSPETVEPKNGYLDWKGLVLDPDAAALPDANGWWLRARDVDAATVRVNNQNEKFVYYDALGDYTPGLVVEWTRDGVTLRNDSPDPFAAVMAVRVKDGVCFSGTTKLAKGASSELTLAKGLPDLASALDGLYKKEASALVDIWHDEFFKSEGVRVLAILARDAYDRLLPIAITPKPDQLSRLLILHLECLDDARVAKIKAWIEDLGSADLETRDTAAAELRKLGPLAEPSLRKAHDATKDPEVKARLLDLLPKPK